MAATRSGGTRTQKDRHISVSSPLGADVLLFRRLDGEERMSQLFEFELELLSETLDVDATKVLGEGMTVRVEIPEYGERFFHGVVSSFRYTGYAGRLATYTATLRPWLWFLTRTADCRIFQNKKVPDIIKEVFRYNKFSDFEESLSGTYRDWEYCVQYRESDYDFVSRLMEHEGIYFFFKHEDGKHTLVLADSGASHGSFPKYESIPFFPRDPHTRRERDHVCDWFVSQDLQSGKGALDDYDFTKPKTGLLVKHKTQKKRPGDGYEVYDYPGAYAEKSDGDRYVAVRVDELQSQYEQVRGDGNARGICPGYLFDLTQYPREDQNRKYLIVSARYSFVSDAYQTTPEGGEQEAVKEEPYACSFYAIDSEQQYRAPRVTPKPFVQGPQTAVVVGKKGEEIWTDKYGRVKVQFHWDRQGKKDENSSCWIRVSQNWAGDKWGSMHIPRMGQEVIVDFLEGDPDRPIITGRVYNNDEMPPYTLPDNKTQSGLKSRSTKDGNSKTFNELRFEDKKDEEEIYFHAEKDFNRVVENNDTLKVGFDKKDEGDQSIDIYNDRTTTLEKGNDKLQIKTGKRDVTIQKDHTVTVKQGNQTTKVNAGKTLHQAAQSITLKVGASSIKIEPAKITLKSPQILIQADAKLDAKAPMTTVSGDATLILKGGIIKIN